MTAKSTSRSAARLAAVQALFQHQMEKTPVPKLLKEFHDHRLGKEIEDDQYHPAERDFFDELVIGVTARLEETDQLVPVATVIDEYLDVAHAFFSKKDAGFVNGLLDSIAKQVRG